MLLHIHKPLISAAMQLARHTCHPLEVRCAPHPRSPPARGPRTSMDRIAFGRNSRARTDCQQSYVGPPQWPIHAHPRTTRRVGGGTTVPLAVQLSDLYTIVICNRLYSGIVEDADVIHVYPGNGRYPSSCTSFGPIPGGRDTPSAWSAPQLSCQGCWCNKMEEPKLITLDFPLLYD